MSLITYDKGILLWIDDCFQDAHMSEISQDVWSKVFGNHSDRLFRLMDLSLEVATSYQDALEAIEAHSSSVAGGTFTFSILDLMIPSQSDGEPRMKYGIAVAKELRKRGMPFVFLSANADASKVLDKAGLGAVPYFIKEPGDIGQR